MFTYNVLKNVSLSLYNLRKHSPSTLTSRTVYSFPQEAAPSVKPARRTCAKSARCEAQVSYFGKRHPRLGNLSSR